MNVNLLYLISSDAAWAGRLDGLVRDERLGRSTFFPLGKGALAAYRNGLPEVVFFDLRQDRRDITVAMTMIREIFPRMAEGGVVVIGAADPDNREALREEREQLSRIQLAEYMPRNTPDEIVMERIHALHQRALESEGKPLDVPKVSAHTAHPSVPDAVLPEAPAAGETALPAPSASAPGETVPCLVKFLLSSPAQQEQLMSELGDLGAEPLSLDIARNPAAVATLPDFLIVDGASAEQHAGLLTQLRRQSPGLRIIQLPDEGDKTLRRLSRDISALLNPNPAADGQQLSRLIRNRVDGAGHGPEVPILLLVEDEQNIRELTAHYLLLQGYEVYQAEDGQEAMAVFRARHPSLILSDVYMPRMNGFKLLLEVKNWAPELPMLMMTGYSSAAQVLNSSKYRNVTFLPKPFRLSELGERIRSMLGVTR